MKGMEGRFEFESRNQAKAQDRGNELDAAMGKVGEAGQREGEIIAKAIERYTAEQTAALLRKLDLKPSIDARTTTAGKAAGD
jgi:hypothetical protein